MKPGKRRTEWPLTIAALIFLIAYAVPIAVPDLPGWAGRLCETVVWIVWAAFAVDFAARFSLAGPARWRFVKENLLDLAVVALPRCGPCDWSGCWP